MANETQPTLTAKQRLLADTPTFFKYLQLIGIGLTGAAGMVITFLPDGNPKMICAIIAGIGTAIATVSQFVVKDINNIANKPDASVQDVLDLIPTLQGQVDELKTKVLTSVMDAKAKGQGDAPAAQIPVVASADQSADTAIPATEAAAPTDAFEQAVQVKMAAIALANKK